MGKAVNHYFSKSKHLTLKPKNLRDELFNIENGRIFVHYFFFSKNCYTRAWKDANFEISGYKGENTNHDAP